MWLLARDSLNIWISNVAESLDLWGCLTSACQSTDPKWWICTRACIIYLQYPVQHKAWKP